jgi:hypothetical protein
VGLGVAAAVSFEVATIVVGVAVPVDSLPGIVDPTIVAVTAAVPFDSPQGKRHCSQGGSYHGERASVRLTGLHPRREPGYPQSHVQDVTSSTVVPQEYRFWMVKKGSVNAGDGDGSTDVHTGEIDGATMMLTVRF